MIRQWPSPEGAVDPAGPTRGLFITLEGPEGAGKSTQIGMLAEALTARGVPILATREPGGSPGAEAIRSLLVTGDPDRWDAETELLLVAAARRDHVVRTIRPALAAGRCVLCDRFSDSTRAYQGGGGGLATSDIEMVNHLATSGLEPDLTLVLDIVPDAGLARTTTRQGIEGRFEALGDGFHSRVRHRFLEIAEREPDRCIVIDAARTPAQVYTDCLAAVLAAAQQSGLVADGR